MKLNFTFKTPDVVTNTLKENVEEADVVPLYVILSKFFKYGEYVTIEVDTKTMKAKVVENA